MPQETILTYAQRLFDLAQTEESVQAKFNKIEFLVTRENFENPTQIADYYLSENQKRYENYKQSPEYEEVKQYKKQQEALLNPSSETDSNIIK